MLRGQVLFAPPGDTQAEQEEYDQEQDCRDAFRFEPGNDLILTHSCHIVPIRQV